MATEDYHVIELIGEGSLGKVYKGRRKYTRQTVAMKFILKHGKTDKDIHNLRQEIEYKGDESEGDGKWEYVEDGPAEIIWQGNEITVKKRKVKVPKKAKDKPPTQEQDRPTSNPLPPHSVAFASQRRESSLSAQEVLEKVAQETPNFGTEQDKAHCPFHLKTGACRFGVRCSRVHFYPDKSFTLLMKNMYNGPGLALEQDEGLEVPRKFTSKIEGKMGYEDFVHFILSEEDKSSEPSQEYCLRYFPFRS